MDDESSFERAFDQTFDKTLDIGKYLSTTIAVVGLFALFMLLRRK